MRNPLRFTLVVVAAVTTVAVVRADKNIAPHPNDLKYPTLDYKIPPAAQFNEKLSNGVSVYITEDRMLPVFDMRIMFRAASAFDPPEKVGLASLTGEELRDGGTKDLTPEELDEKVEFLATRITTNIGETSGMAGLSLLSKDIDEGIGLFREILKNPRFDETRFRLAKDRRLQDVKRRNDSTTNIERSEFSFLMDGEDHFSNHYSTTVSLNAITRDDLIAFHKKYIHPGNMIVAVYGDFNRKEMIKKLEKFFADWPAGEPAPKTFPKPDFTPKPGVYMVEKEGINQGRISIGHKSVMRGSPDEFPLIVMNGVLGSSGFHSRLVARVRSDEGLAYNTGSAFGQGEYWPGDFRAWFQSKSNSCAYATKIVLEEVKRLRDEKVEAKDIEDTVNYFVESFPQRFPSRLEVVTTYMDDEYSGRDSAYWLTYMDNLRKVKADDVQRVAQKYLHPDQLVILAVGDVDAMEKGGHDKGPDLHFSTFGPVTKLPLRNPETMKR
ncbi:MAG: insulinase family protein [Planctomycetes bacterium]|nr:insulinase family protein [Planctomycetota bacterium]MBI3834724.1 insulinase family protein [Planctomycetota bacterium]